MKKSLMFVGIGVVIIAIGLILINRNFTAPVENGSTTTGMATSTLTLTSTAFTQNSSIPSQYTCDGSQVSPPLTISGAPEGTKSYALIVEDPDVPKQVLPSGLFVHWVLFNIPASITEITEGAQVGTDGANGAGKAAYAGPCPPPQYEPSEHRYFFKLYALDRELSLKAGVSKEDVEKAMQGHILAEAQLIGKYKRK
jgi:Raf kinase inhibitor-like YbhB/YbcL family protein